VTRQCRNRAWYGKQDRDGFIHRSWMKNQGFPDHAFDGRPVLGGDISDPRMSGTAYSTVILHVSPEAQAGGPLAFVKTGDRIRVSASVGALDLMVSDAEFATRRAAWAAGPAHYNSGYAKLYTDHVLQADKGADLDFLAGKDTRPVTRESH